MTTLVGAPLARAPAVGPRRTAPIAGAATSTILRPRTSCTGLCLFSGLRKQSVELVLRQSLEGAEVGTGKRRRLEGTQQLEALTLCSLLLCLPLLVLGTSPIQLLAGNLLVLRRDLAGLLPIQVEAMRRLDDCIEIGRASRMAAQEGGQLLLAELTGRTLLDIRLNAQLHRLRRTSEQRREQRLELLGTSRLLRLLFSARLRSRFRHGLASKVQKADCAKSGPQCRMAPLARGHKQAFKCRRMARRKRKGP